MTSKYGNKQEKYSAFTDSLQSYLSQVSKGEDNGVVFIWGAHDHLLQKTSHFLFSSLKKKFASYECVKLDLKDIHISSFQEVFQQQSLFDDGQVYYIQRCEQKTNFDKYLKALGENGSGHKVVMTYAKARLTKGIENEIKRLGWTSIQCVAPPTYKIPQYIQQSAKQHKLKLSAKTCEYLQMMLGDNLALIDNELNRLSLLFAEHKDEVSQDMIAKHCHFIREDEAFKITDLIIEGKQSRVEALLHKLLLDGMQPLSIVGIIARLLRTTAYIQSPGDADKVKLPPRIKEKYRNYGRKISTSCLQRGLIACQEADGVFKSSRVNPLIALTEIITVVTPSQH